MVVSQCADDCAGGGEEESVEEEIYWSKCDIEGGGRRSSRRRLFPLRASFKARRTEVNARRVTIALKP